MSEMTPERFRQIVDAYGASPDRWPAGEREAAQEFVAGNGREAKNTLREAAALDRFLATRHIEQPTSGLVGRILADASSRRSRQRRWNVIWGGTAFAGFGLAGILSGALAVALFLPLNGGLDGNDDGAVLTAFQPHATANDEWDGEE